MRALQRLLLRLRIALDEAYLARCCGPDNLIASLDAPAWRAHLEALRVRLAVLEAPRAPQHTTTATQ